MDPFRPFPATFKARFLNRPNRFLLECEKDGQRLLAFLPNPGRLQELLLPGCLIHLIREEAPGARKTAYTAVAVERDDSIIMLHTHRTNDVARYLLQEGMVPGLEHAVVVRPEVRVGHSRFDFLLRDEDGEIFTEVKSCTLAGKQVAMFPDAVTERGARHLLELARLSREGTRTVVLFIIHHPSAGVFMPDYHTDLHFARTFLEVRPSVTIIPIGVRWQPDLSLSREVRLFHIPWGYIEREAEDRGSYLLILKLHEDQHLPIGTSRRALFKKGFYIYVGSAMTNLTARMERHRHIRKKHHWHIDWLRDRAEFQSVLAIRASVRLECDIAGALSGISDWSIRGFGCTDCSCGSHLFAMARNPLDSRPFHDLLQYFRMDRYMEG